MARQQRRLDRTEALQNRLICAFPPKYRQPTAKAHSRRTLESGYVIRGGCEGSSSWTCSRVRLPASAGRVRDAATRGNLGSCRRRRCSRECVHDRATRPEKRHHGHAKTTPEYRRSARAPGCRPHECLLSVVTDAPGLPDAVGPRSSRRGVADGWIVRRNRGLRCLAPGLMQLPEKPSRRGGHRNNRRGAPGAAL